MMQEKVTSYGILNLLKNVLNDQNEIYKKKYIIYHRGREVGSNLAGLRKSRIAL